MKLFSKIKSERAEKSQGGNKKITIELFVGSAQNSVKIAEGELEALPQGGYNLYFSSTLPNEDENQCVDMHIEESEISCQNRDTNGNACWNCEANMGTCGDADEQEKGENPKA